MSGEGEVMPPTTEMAPFDSKPEGVEPVEPESEPRQQESTPVSLFVGNVARHNGFGFAMRGNVIGANQEPKDGWSNIVRQFPVSQSIQQMRASIPANAQSQTGDGCRTAIEQVLIYGCHVAKFIAS